MTTRDELLQSITDPSPINPFAVSYLQLCQLSYLLPSDAIPSQVATLSPLNPGGYWQCSWGPTTDDDLSNLAFVATYYYGPNLPVLAAVVLRGTDIDVNSDLGIIEQIYEDMDVLNQSPLPWDLNGPALIANGTLDALIDIQSLNFEGQGLVDYLSGFLGDPANHNPVLVVTGHSLGGCLVSVVAPWLQFALALENITVPIVPCSFAGPSAGNADFAEYFQNTFGYSMRYHNSLDVAPYAWSNLSAIENIYDPDGLPAPDLAWDAIYAFEGAMELAGVNYAQPSSGNPLTGQFSPGLGWYGEVYLQHHTATYMALLGGTTVAAGARR